jgi:hypothetical protein
MKDEEKKSCINESENAGMAAEPVGTAVRGDVSTQGYDIDKWPGMPLVGPANIDEMNARVDQAEQEMDHDNGFSWDQVMLDAQTIVNRYANHQDNHLDCRYMGQAPESCKIDCKDWQMTKVHKKGPVLFV